MSSNIITTPEVRRSDLAALVWNHTVRDLAKIIGVSDVLLYKFCRKWNVPTPTKAQRGKLMAGKEVARTPLPALTDEITEDPIVIHIREGLYGLRWPKIIKKGLGAKNIDSSKKNIEQLSNQVSLRQERTKEPRIELYTLRILYWEVQCMISVPYLRKFLEDWRIDARLTFKCEIERPAPLRGRPAKVALDFVENADQTDADTLSVGWLQDSCRIVDLLARSEHSSVIFDLLNTRRVNYLHIETISEDGHQDEDVLRYTFATCPERFEET